MDTVAKQTRLLLADDHPAMLEQITRLLAGGFEIVGTASNGLDLIEAAARLDPDVVVLDITMPGLDGIEAARRLQGGGCRAKLVFLTVHEDLDYVRAGLDAGGAAFVTKARLASDLIPAIRAALAGQCFVSPTLHAGTSGSVISNK
jgi:DNA-binding NarL/FixJ family response regulator